MSAGMLAAQCCHASMAFITSPMRNGNCQWVGTGGITYKADIDTDVYKEWIASQTGVSHTAISQRMKTIRKRLQKQLRDLV